MNTVVEINDLRVEFPGRELRERPKLAVDGLNLQVRSGEVFGFLGPNGAGKTTTMNVLLGFVNATSGSASIFGVDVRQPIARQRIGYLPELTYYYKFLNTEELLRFYARIFRIPRGEREKRIDCRPQTGRSGSGPQTPDQDLFQRHAAARRPGPGADQ